MMMAEKIGMQWYVIEALSRADAAAVATLTELGVEAWRPMRTVYRADRRARSRRPIHKKGEPAAKRDAPRFPPFVFVKCEFDESGIKRAMIESAKTRWGEPLVRRFLCGAGTLEPAVIPSELIDFYRDFTPISGASVVCFEVGQIVEVTIGPFAGHLGAVASVDMRGWLWVDIELFGRSTPYFVEVEHVRPSEMCLTKSPPGRAFSRAANRDRLAQTAKL